MVNVSATQVICGNGRGVQPVPLDESDPMFEYLHAFVPHGPEMPGAPGVPGARERRAGSHAHTVNTFAKIVDNMKLCTTMHPMSKTRTAAAITTSAVAGFFVWKFPGPMIHLGVCLLAAGLFTFALVCFSKGGPR